MAASEKADILLVEDSPTDEVLAIRALKKHKAVGCVIVAHDGEEALNILLGKSDEHPQIKPRLIFLDIKLPKLTGLEVLKRIKTEPATRRIPVVVLTSSSEERDVLESYDLGANSYILKPVDYDQFTSLMEEIVLYWLVINHPPARHLSNVKA